MPEVVADPLCGKVVDERYRIGARIGAGGMGIVYEAEHTVLGTKLALKVLRGEVAADEESVQRFTREAQSASAIGHDHIVEVRDFGRLPDGAVYIVMERIEGTDLETMLTRAPIPWERARTIARQVCEALDAAHAIGIVHRDLKPDNVLITKRGDREDFVKIVDFGIAKVQRSAKVTVAGRVMGTPEYMSPEQCLGQAVDHRADVYSLGIVLYEMLTQELPYYSEDLREMLRLQIQETPRPPSHKRPDVDIPRALEAIVMRCLAKDAAARFGSMREVMDALAQVTPDESIDIVVDPAPTPTMPISVMPAKRRRGWMLAPIALVAAALGAGIVVWRLAPEPIEAREPIAAPIEAPVPMPPQATTVDVAPPAVAAPVIAPAVIASARSSEILVVSDPPGARVFAGDALLGDTPLRVARPDARMELALEHDGYTRTDVTLGPISQDSVRIVLPRRVRARRVEAPAPNAAPEPVRSEPARSGSPRPRRHREFLDPWAG
jgi:hypothetical protein